MYLKYFACLIIVLEVVDVTYTTDCEQSDNIYKLQTQLQDNKELILQFQEGLRFFIYGTNVSITNAVENQLKILKTRFDVYLNTVKKDKDFIKQDCAYLNLRSNELQIDNIDKSLATLQADHFFQHSSLNEINDLIADNRNFASNESLKLKLKLDERSSELNAIKQLMRRVKVLATDEITNCADVVGTNNSSNIYNLYLPMSGLKLFKVYCLPDTSHGKTWTIVQRRQDNSTNFFRGWDDYKNGFGDPSGNYWIGLEKLHALTSTEPHELWIQLEDFEGNTRSANYSAFGIGDEASKYELTTLGSYNGNAGDSLTAHMGQKFSTFDADNDIVDINCAFEYQGAWWYKNCLLSNLNGVYKKNARERGVIWFHWHGIDYSLKYVHMAIRPQTNK